MTPGSSRDRRWVSIASVITLLVLWELASLFIGHDALSAPVATARAVGSASADGYLWSDLAVTCSRLVAAAGLGFVVSLVLGLALGLSPAAGRFFGLWVTIAASLPALVYLVACYLVIGVSDRAAIVAVALIVAPSTTVTVWDGVRTADPALREMGRAFDADRGLVLRRVIIPQALPWIFAAARGCWSLSWRIMVFAELLARPDGVGYRIQYWFNLDNMSRVMASALPFVVFIVAVDVLVFRSIETRLDRWRTVAA